MRENLGVTGCMDARRSKAKGQVRQFTELFPSSEPMAYVEMFLLSL